MKLIATFITAFLAVTLAISEEEQATSKDCNAQLVVEKNRASKSADEEGAQFILVLTNTSRQTQTYSLSTKSLSQPCNNKTQYNRGTGSGNVTLDATFQNTGLNRNSINTSNNDVQLNSGESYKFIVDVQVPEGTRFKTWSCIEVEVTSKACDAIVDSQILSVYVTDPSEE